MIKKYLKSKKTAPIKIDVKSEKPVSFGKERRQYFRINVEIPILLVPINEGAQKCGYCHEEEINIPFEKMKTQMVNLSGGGIYTLWDHAFILNSHVGIFMALKGVKEEGFVICGEVLRCEQVGKRFGIALKFLCRRQFKQNYILRFIMNTERELIAQRRIGWIK